MPLTDVAIRSAKPDSKPFKLADGGGMFLLVSPAGGKLWRLKYRFDGKEKLLALGAYPEISLLKARERREAARRLLADGIDPSDERVQELLERMVANEDEWETKAVNVAKFLNQL